MEVPPLPEDPLKRKAKPLAIPPSPPRQEPPFETWRLDYESDLEQMVEDDYAIQYGPGVLGISILLRSAFVFFVLLLAFLLLPKDIPFKIPAFAALASAWITIRSLGMRRRIKADFRKANRGLFEGRFPVPASWVSDGESLTFLPAATTDVLAISFQQVNLTAVGAQGTLLCARPFYATFWNASPGTNFAIPIPASYSTLGMQFSAQAASIDGGGIWHLTNALDCTVGNQ